MRLPPELAPSEVLTRLQDVCSYCTTKLDYHGDPFFDALVSLVIKSLRGYLNSLRFVLDSADGVRLRCVWHDGGTGEAYSLCKAAHLYSWW